MATPSFKSIPNHVSTRRTPDRQKQQPRPEFTWLPSSNNKILVLPRSTVTTSTGCLGQAIVLKLCTFSRPVQHIQACQWRAAEARTTVDTKPSRAAEQSNTTGSVKIAKELEFDVFEAGLDKTCWFFCPGTSI